MHVLEHRTYHEGVIHEIAYNFYVETTDGTVCYFGEDVEFYDASGDFANTDGTWRAGESGSLPGVIMPASPVGVCVEAATICWAWLAKSAILSPLTA